MLKQARSRSKANENFTEIRTPCHLPIENLIIVSILKIVGPDHNFLSSEVQFLWDKIQ
jgi:hypothetical protein